MYNRRLRRKYLKQQASKDNEDPLVLSDEIASDDEWVTGEDYIMEKSTDEYLEHEIGQSSGSMRADRKKRRTAGKVTLMF